jgi:hypothetical protein
MLTAVPNLAFLAVGGFSPGQVSLLNYVSLMGRLDGSPFLRSPFNAENIPERIVGDIRRGKRLVWDAPLCAATCLVLRSASYERTLLQGLGLSPKAADTDSAPWRSDSRFSAAVDGEVGRLRRAVREATGEVKGWMRAFRRFPDAGQYFDVTQEEGLAASLSKLQAFFARSIRQAREVEVEYGPRSLAGVEAYFQLARQRKSGPIPRLSAGIFLGLPVSPKNV